MPFSFPNNPSVGQQSTQNGRTYQWSGYAWEIAASGVSLDASQITSGTFDAARLPLATTIAAGAVIVGTGLGVSSGTVSVTYGTSAGTTCQGNDSRLSDTRTPTDGSVTTAKIANDAVTYAKLQNVSATDRLLGRSSAGSGDVEEITCTAFGRSLIGSADSAAARTTLSVQPTASPAFTGTVSAAAANFTGAVSVTSPLTLTGTVAGNVRQIKMQTSGVDRWQITPSFDAETGSNAGSNFHITRWSDAGSFMGTPLYITRSTGVVNCESGLTIVSGQLLVTAGSASAPGVAFSGDTNTGMFSPSADVLAWATNGSERFRVASNGDAQVGGVNVVGLRYFDVRNTDSTLNSGAIMRLITRNAANTTDTSVDLLRYNSGLFVIANNDNGPIALYTGGSERVRVKSTGSVRFVPLSADPSTGNEAGDVYYNSSTNKLRVYNGTSWVDLH